MAATVRFLHTADLHLDSPLSTLATRNSGLGELMQDASRRVLTRLVDTALKQQVDALLIAGDLFDGDQRDVHTAMVLQRELRRLEAAAIPVFIIWGNHDAEARLLDVLELPDNVHAFDGRGGKRYFANEQAVVHGVSYSRRQAPDSLLGKYAKPDAQCFNIGLLHTSLTGAEGHNDYAPCTVNELIDKGYDYWALGHIHKRSVHHRQPAVVMPGNPLGRHINESGERSVSLVTLTAGEAPDIQCIELAPVRFDRLTVSLDACDDKRYAYERILEELKRHRESLDTEHLVVRVQLCGSTSLATYYQREHQALLVQLQTEFEHRDDLWIDSVDARALRLPVYDSAATSTEDPLLAELQLLAGSKLLQTANLQDAVSEDLALLVRALPSELGELFGKTPEDERRFIAETLLPAGAAWILHQLGNAGESDLDADSYAQDDS
ncbi:MAG: DNA repair exonuclease [Granulosicoccus sp.]|nr:DNA repair exonuclease [Granulosicoccus sp.]